jgi:hypothetical protein
MVPVVPVIAGITFDVTFHMRWNSVMRSLYFKIYSASFLIILLSQGIATSVNIPVSFLLSRIMMSGLLLGLVHTCWFRNMITLPSWHVSTGFGTWSYQCSLSNFIPVSLHMLQRSWAHTLSRLFEYCSLSNIGHADMMCSTVSSDFYRFCIATCFCL